MKEHKAGTKKCLIGCVTGATINLKGGEALEWNEETEEFVWNI